MALFQRTTTAVLLAFAALFLASQSQAIHTENINWDEFAMVDRVQRTIRSGELIGSGRPGLVSLMLVPIVKGCQKSVDAVVSGRRV
ncbi:MAG: hypothetical protein ACRD2N_21905 [Vicinamibacterales bacterium]